MRPPTAATKASGVGVAITALLLLLNLAALQVFKKEFVKTEVGTIVGGFVSSLLFVLALTVRPSPRPTSPCHFDQ